MVDGELNASSQAEKSSALLRLLISSMTSKGLVLPKRSLTDTLNLRSDPRIVDFRQMLWEGVDLIEKGELDEAEYVVKKLDETNEYMHKMNRVKKVNDWLLYLSVPSLAADAIIGAPLFGAAFGVSSLGLKSAEHAYTEKLGWRFLLQAPNRNK